MSAWFQSPYLKKREKNERKSLQILIPDHSGLLNQHLLDLAKNLVFRFPLLVPAAHIHSLALIEYLLKVLNILQSELFVDDIKVSNGIHLVNMGTLKDMKYNCNQIQLMKYTYNQIPIMKYNGNQEIK